MAHDVKSQLTTLLQQATATDTPIHLERPRDPTHGDFATNLAMQLAKALKKNPREIAQQLLAELPPSKLVIKAEVAGAGFINFHAGCPRQDRCGARRAGRRRELRPLDAGWLAEGAGRVRLGQPDRPAARRPRPRCGLRRFLASLLAFAGWDVTREYYVNDAGRQMDILGLSTWLRYLEQNGETLPFPPNAYQGELRARHGRR
jgi:arginyl-tRNA synthetase